VDKVITLADRIAILDEINAGLEIEAEKVAGSTATFQSWLQSEVNKTLTSPAVVAASSKDGMMLAKLCRTITSQDVFNK
jgi:hypothetical protein